ncbi:MAG: aminotransferase class III-fold pyridoxal phosphate-dependent enzyme [Bryobacterales bacterium]|nr:aminotransferase class III-fold pyridoxal phosphate-dependent enzyme [Bryobacterales bacterium]
MAAKTAAQRYADKTPRSAALYRQASAVLPSGIAHVARYLEPHPPSMERAAGSHKWDVDGNEYVDYFGGHGALLLGHNHPAVIEAAAAQMARGVHYGASHPLEVEWATLIQQMIPCAQKVRFTVTGTEATHLGIRLVRAYAGKPVVIRFAYHFHGWHDHVSFPAAGAAPGIPQGVQDGMLVLPPGDIDAVRHALATRTDIAAIMVEPTGASFGHAPLPAGFLAQLRALTAAHHVLLFFDEVISGFRCTPGGAQQFYGITPDLASLAKIVAGGFPGAALAGKAEILAALEFNAGPPRVMHQGTYNASPVSAAAGIATLKIIRDTDAIARANRAAAQVREAMNAAIARKGVNWCVYGEFSDFHIYAGAPGETASVDAVYSGASPAARLKTGMPARLIHALRCGLLSEGVDIAGWPGGLTSCAHSDADIERTAAAFAATLEMLGEEGAL